MTTQDWNEKHLVEDRLIAQLQRLGYTYIHGSYLEGERQTLRDVILLQRLSDAVRRINPWISRANGSIACYRHPFLPVQSPLLN